MPRTTENAWSPRKLLSLTACVLLLAAAVIVLPARSAESLLPGKGATEVSFQYVHALIGEDSSGTCPRIEASEPEMGEVKNFLQDLNIRWHGFHGDVYDIDVPGYHLYFYDESSMSQVDIYISSICIVDMRPIESYLPAWRKFGLSSTAYISWLIMGNHFLDAAYKRMKKSPEGNHGFLSGGFLYKRRSRKD